MPIQPSEDSRLLGTPTSESPALSLRSEPDISTDQPDIHSREWAPPPEVNPEGWGKRSSRPVNINIMKRNMSVAKGFIDISLMMANASQLKHLLMLGDPSDKLYHVIFVGLIVSLILQVATGIMLILKERFDLDVVEDHYSAQLYNDITLALVFATLSINVFVSSLGVSVLQHPVVPPNGGYPIKGQGQGYPRNYDSLAPRNAFGNTSTTTFPTNAPIGFSG